MRFLHNRKQIRNLIVFINALQALLVLVVSMHILLGIEDIKMIYVFPVLPLNKCAYLLLFTSASLMLLSTYLVTELNRTSEIETQLINEKNAHDLSEQNLRLLRCHRHDFLNHLQVILGYIQLGKNVQACDYIMGINEELKGIREISGLNMPELSVLLLVMRQKALDNRIELTYDIKADLSDLTVDQKDLVRILTNLIDNAIFELKDMIGENKIINVSIKMDGKTLNIEVFNSGSYIPKQYNVFTYGFTTKGNRGTGLGLYVVKELVEKKYKGSIELVSERGYGTKFSIAI